MVIDGRSTPSRWRRRASGLGVLALVAAACGATSPTADPTSTDETAGGTAAATEAAPDGSGAGTGEIASTDEPDPTGAEEMPTDDATSAATGDLAAERTGGEDADTTAVDDGTGGEDADDTPGSDKVGDAEAATSDEQTAGEDTAPGDGCSTDGSPTGAVSADGPAPAIEARADAPDGPFPDLVVRRINCAGGWVQLRDELPAAQPVLLWFWAPH